MGNDREGASGMTSDWTTPEYLANISAEELARALDMHGIQAHNVGADEDGVTVSFAGLRSAETLLTLTLEGTDQQGSLYDRATSSCVTLSNLPDDATDGDVADAFASGWAWIIHPHMTGRVMGWHVSVTLPAADADQLTARLNELKRGYAV